jgi:hypothetical protein
MTKKILIASAVLAIAASASPAAAVTNLIKNGSFEKAGTTGTGAFTNWTKTNVPSNAPASVIPYNVKAAYPNGAFNELVTPDSLLTSASPDAVGTHAAYFVGDFSVNESINQLTYLGVGNYRVGFSYYLTQNGLNNVGNASFGATIIGVPVAMTNITGSSVAKTWFYATGVGQITKAGYYNTAFVFNSNRAPSKDIVIDRVFALPTTDQATVIIPPNPTAVPEPATWAMLIIGFGLVGVTSRRRRRAVAA